MAPVRATRATTSSRKATARSLSASRQSSGSRSGSCGRAARDVVGLVEASRRWKLPMRICEWLKPHQHAERVGEGSSPRSSSSPVSIRLKLFEVSTPSASSIAVASTSRTPPLRVSRPSAPRDHGVVPLPLVPRSSRRPSAGRAAARTGSRGRRRDPGCRSGTGGRDSAAPGALEATRKRREPAEMARSTPLRSSRRVRHGRPSAGCGSAGYVAGSPQPSPRRRIPGRGRRGGWRGGNRRSRASGLVGRAVPDHNVRDRHLDTEPAHASSKDNLRPEQTPCEAC